MGVAAQDTFGRVAASLGDLDAVTPQFQPALDVPSGGVLLALPALLAMGLLKYTERFFSLPKGYYGLDSLFLLLAFMALTRLQHIESLRYCAPGEWGTLLGLDRIPEVRTLRRKVQLLSGDDQAKAWSAELCRYWMTLAPEAQANVLYIDGHVRVYHGDQTQLPRHHVARQKLCLRATTDYWVNAMDGQPFMVVNQVVDPGLIKTIENTLLPELKARLPPQVLPQTQTVTRPVRINSHWFLTGKATVRTFWPNERPANRRSHPSQMSQRRLAGNRISRTQAQLADGRRNARQTRRAGCLFKNLTVKNCIFYRVCA